jgi:HSP20 family protein
MLMRFEQFHGSTGSPRECSANAEQARSRSTPTARGNEFTIHLDLPGVDPRFIAVTAEKDLLAVRATRAWFPAEEDRIQMTERPQGDSPPAVPR